MNKATTRNNSNVATDGKTTSEAATAARFSGIEIPAGAPVSGENGTSSAIQTAARMSSLEIPADLASSSLSEAPQVEAPDSPAVTVNLGAFEADAGSPVIRSSKAGKDARGNWRTALGHEATEDHHNVARVWQDKCEPLPAIISHVLTDSLSKRDVSVSIADMRMDPSTGAIGGFPVAEYALKHLGKITEVPMAMVSYLHEREAFEDLAKYVNADIDARIAQDPGKEFLCRLKGDDLRFIGTDRYAPIDNLEALGMIGVALGDKDLSKVLVSHFSDQPEKMSGSLLIPDSFKDCPDSPYGVGIAFSNSETGSGAFEVLPYLFRAICVNGMIWSRMNSKTTVRQIHSGNIDMRALQAQVNAAVTVALSQGVSLLNQFQQAREIPITADVDRLILQLSKASQFSAEVSREWKSAFAVEPEMNAAGIINGLTRAAQGFNGERERELQEAAGLLLAPSLEASLMEVSRRWNAWEAQSAEITNDQLARVFQYA